MGLGEHDNAHGAEMGRKVTLLAVLMIARAPRMVGA